MRIFILALSVLFLQNCSNTKEIRCSNFFESCTEKSVITGCDNFVADTTITIGNKVMNSFSGPLSFKEINKIKDSDLSNHEFNNQSKEADSFWWYSRWNGNTGSEGIMAIKDCSIISELNLTYYVSE